MLFWKVLCVTNTILNIFISVVIGFVLYQAVKKYKSNKQQILKNSHYMPKRSK